MSDSHKQKISRALTGVNNHFYKDGRCSEPGYWEWSRRKTKIVRRTRMNGIKGSHTHRDWVELKAKVDNRCLACGLQEPEIKLTVDHIVPISRGGTNDIGNIQPLCITCNLVKGTKTINYAI